MARALWIVVAAIAAGFVAVSVFEARLLWLSCGFFILWGVVNVCFGVYRLANAEWRQSAWWQQREILAWALGAGTTHFPRTWNRRAEFYTAGTQVIAGGGLIVLGCLALR